MQYQCLCPEQAMPLRQLLEGCKERGFVVLFFFILGGKNQILEGYVFLKMLLLN